MNDFVKQVIFIRKTGKYPTYLVINQEAEKLTLKYEKR